MKYVKTFIFNSGESSEEMDSSIDEWLAENNADIVSTSSSISARPDSSDVCAVLITIVYQPQGVRGRLRRR